MFSWLSSLICEFAYDLLCHELVLFCLVRLCMLTSQIAQ